MTKITDIQDPDRIDDELTCDRSGKSTPCLTREDWNRRYAIKEFLWTVEPNLFLTDEIANFNTGRALDLASGEGRNAVWLAEQGWIVHGIDFSAVAIEKARQLAAGRGVSNRIDFTVADLIGYEPEARSFDLVAIIYLQIPFAQLAPIITRAARAVAPGGTFLLVAHDLENLTKGYGGPRHPDVLYTAEQVTAALGGDLEIEKACRVERFVEVNGSMEIAMDCLVKAGRPHGPLRRQHP